MDNCVELIKNKILSLYCDYDTVYGPYLRKDGRKHIVLSSGSGGNKKTVSWPRVIYEAISMEKLPKNITIDHIDGNHENNSPENIQLLSVSDNIKKSYKQGKITVQARYGENNNSSVLTKVQVNEIRSLYESRKTKYDRTCSERSLAARFSVSRSTIRSIIKKTTWCD